MLWYYRGTHQDGEDSGHWAMAAAPNVAGLEFPGIQVASQALRMFIDLIRSS